MFVGDNKVAHNLAQLSCVYGELRVWMEEVHVEVMTFVLNVVILMNE